VRRPAGHVLEQANRADATIGAEVEPVQGASRHANQIAGFDFNRQHRAGGRVDMKESVTRDDETHFILIVPVFPIELLQHRVETGGVGIDVNHVGGNVAAALFQFFDLVRISAQNLVLRRVVRDRMLGAPTFVVDTVARQQGSYFLFVLDRSVFVSDRYDSHRFLPFVVVYE